MIFKKDCPVCELKNKVMSKMKVTPWNGNRVHFHCSRCGLSAVSFVTLDEMGREKTVVKSNVVESPTQ